MNNNYNDYYLYPKQPTSACDVLTMNQQRNPIIETDRNIEKSLNENIKQTQQLNHIIDVTSKNVEAISNLTNQTKLNQEATNKQFKTSLFVSIVVGLFAAGSFILELLPYIINFTKH